MLKSRLNTALAMLATVTLSIVLCGCSTTIPAKLQVRDTGSGRTYTTYQPWGEVHKGIGYEFSDAETGNKVTLTNYELKTLEAQKSVANDSPEAKAFNDAKAKAGVK